MLEQKYQIGQKVEAQTTWDGCVAGVIRGVEVVYVVEFTSPAGTTSRRTEDQIREPRPTPEQAWEKVGLLVGKRSTERPDYCCIDRENYDRETRHQCYQLLGSAQIKITDEVKANVRRLIELADNM